MGVRGKSKSQIWHQGAGCWPPRMRQVGRTTQLFPGRPVRTFQPRFGTTLILAGSPGSMSQEECGRRDNILNLKSTIEFSYSGFQ